MRLNNLPIGLAYISISIASLSIQLAIRSIELGNKSSEIAEESKEIANESKIIAQDSDEKMKDIALSVYQEIEGIFEDRRLRLIKSRRIINEKKKMKLNTMIDEFELHQDVIFNIWKCLTYLRQVKPLIKWIDEEKQIRIIHLLEKFYMELKRDIMNLKIVINPEYIKHLKEMHGIVSEFDSYLKPTNKKHIPEPKQLLEQVLNTNKKLTTKTKLSEKK